MPQLTRLSRIIAPLALLALGTAEAGAHPAGVSFRYVWRHRVRAGVVTVNLKDVHCKVSVALPKRGVGSRESFRTVLRRTRPAAAVTGTYFGLKSGQPVGDIVVGGHLVNSGFVGTALAITHDNEARFIETRRWKDRDWSDYETVLCGGPRLVTAGRARVVPHAEGFRDRSLFARRPSTAAGVTYRNRLILVTVARPIYLRQLARVMRSLGCRDAIALDGGSSSAMFYRGRFAARPKRSLTNVLVVYDTSAGYNRALGLGRLAPGITMARRPSTPPVGSVAVSRAAERLPLPRARVAAKAATTSVTSSTDTGVPASAPDVTLARGPSRRPVWAAASRLPRSGFAAPEAAASGAPSAPPDLLTGTTAAEEEIGASEPASVATAARAGPAGF